MTITKKILTRFLLMLTLGFAMTSCDDTESYSDLLNEQEKAVNWYLADQKVELELPADSVSFITGKDAPFYKLDEDGNVYMQVIDKGDLDDKVKNSDIVYFRFMRKNIRALYMDMEANWEGNADDMGFSNTYFVYGNTLLNTSRQFGQGIQKPLQFLGYNSEVNLVLKSLEGFQEDETVCLPYIINIRYFRPEY